MTCNSKGTYRTAAKLSMAAFDKLPPSARKALADAVFSWAPQPVLTRWRKGLPGYRSGPDIAKTIARWDKKHLSKPENRRGKQ